MWQPLPCRLVKDADERAWLWRWIWADRVQWFCLGCVAFSLLRLLELP